MLRLTITILSLVLSLTTVANALHPKVVITAPDNGEIDVATDITEICVEFDQSMAAKGWSIVGGGPTFPHMSGKPRWENDKTLIVPVTLEPDHQYQMNINSDTFKGFCNRQGEPAEWYPLRFKTRAAAAAPAVQDVTRQQNEQAFAALKDAIGKNYSYVDRKKIDWGTEFANRQSKFENASSVNEFARLAAHLLRLAEDTHVSVEAGGVRIFTRTNSTPPNFNLQFLQENVPGWTRRPSGLISGRFEDGIGYILFAQCNKQQADDFDLALQDLINTRAMIVDVRFNGGGDETAAQRVAGRFTEKTTVYSKARLLENGKWTGPFDRLVKPRDDVKHYTKPVAVLIGPKVVSSAESFVLMMKCGGGARLVGETTCGSSGRPIPHQLGNGVTVYLPSWEDQLPDGTVLEARGIKPDTIIKTNLRDLEKSDAVLEAALNFLRTSKTTSP